MAEMTKEDRKKKREEQQKAVAAWMDKFMADRNLPALTKQFTEQEERFRKANVVTAQAVLDMAKTIYDLHAALFRDVDMSGQTSILGEQTRSKQQTAKNPLNWAVDSRSLHPATSTKDVALRLWTQFRAKSKLLHKSTFSQWRTIGREYDKLVKHIDALPSSWYTLYQLARLDARLFAPFVKKGAIHPMMTQGQAKALAGKEDKPKRAATAGLPYGFNIRIANLDRLSPADAKEIQKKIADFIKTLPNAKALGVTMEPRYRVVKEQKKAA